MKYNGMKLNEFKSDKPVLFDPPKQMICWNNEGEIPEKLEVHAYLPASGCCPVKCWNCNMTHCAEIPEASKPRRATNFELMKWLAQGNGYSRNVRGTIIWTDYEIELECDAVNQPCHENIRIRKWEDTEWHEPTVDYMGLEE